ncbi:MAG: 30S ribosomal protein S3 [Candidatus Pacebacteria bacterium]|nr:30S ribosomal protein S3 [Candidatus Paceibacterota bacterium]
MGHKVNPIAFRIGQGVGWSSSWFAARSKAYRKNLRGDIKVRGFLMEKLKLAGIVAVEIKRSINKVSIVLHVSRPGVVIGRGGAALEDLKKELEKLVIVPEPEKNLNLDVVEVKSPDLSAHLIATQIVEQLKRRFPHRRVIAKVMERVMAAGAKGVKIVLSGRIGGAEISRTEKFGKGKVPLQTLRANIDYDQEPALTKFGYIGVKVWIYTGE